MHRPNIFNPARIARRPFEPTYVLPTIDRTGATTRKRRGVVGCGLSAVRAGLGEIGVIDLGPSAGLPSSVVDVMNASQGVLDTISKGIALFKDPQIVVQAPTTVPAGTVGMGGGFAANKGLLIGLGVAGVALLGILALRRR